MLKCLQCSIEKLRPPFLANTKSAVFCLRFSHWKVVPGALLQNQAHPCRYDVGLTGKSLADEHVKKKANRKPVVLSYSDICLKSNSALVLIQMFRQNKHLNIVLHKHKPKFTVNPMFFMVQSHHFPSLCTICYL